MKKFLLFVVIALLLPVQAMAERSFHSYYTLSTNPLVLTHSNGNAIIKNSNGEGIAGGSESRWGLEEGSRMAILCDVGDIDTDFGLSAASNPVLYIYGANASSYTYYNYNSLSCNGQYSLGSSCFSLNTTADRTAGDMLAFGSSTNIELTDSDGQQSWVSISPKINQSATAAADGVYINSTNTALGSGATGDGNNLLRGAVSGVTMFKFSMAGELSAYTNEDIEAASDTLTAEQCMGGQINNYGQANDVTMTLPAAAKGMSFKVLLGTTVAKYYRLDPAAGDKIYLDGTAGTDGHYCGIASAVAGACIVFQAFQTGAGPDYDWYASTVSGTFVME